MQKFGGVGCGYNSVHNRAAIHFSIFAEKIASGREKKKKQARTGEGKAEKGKSENRESSVRSDLKFPFLTALCIPSNLELKGGCPAEQAHPKTQRLWSLEETRESAQRSSCSISRSKFQRHEWKSISGKQQCTSQKSGRNDRLKNAPRSPPKTSFAWTNASEA